MVITEFTARRKVCSEASLRTSGISKEMMDVFSETDGGLPARAKDI